MRALRFHRACVASRVLCAECVTASNVIGMAIVAAIFVRFGLLDHPPNVALIRECGAGGFAAGGPGGGI